MGFPFFNFSPGSFSTTFITGVIPLKSLDTDCIVFTLLPVLFLFLNLPLAPCEFALTPIELIHPVPFPLPEIPVVAEFAELDALVSTFLVIKGQRQSFWRSFVRSIVTRVLFFLLVREVKLCLIQFIICYVFSQKQCWNYVYPYSNCQLYQ